ncbi:hypothetical protein HanIR_Chr12g0582221 [Helianthus annuus]|nr:hypothetical protein HanIR_Chr12g0582221 [Helianthus annuus]
MWFNQPLSPRVDTEADILLRLPPPHVHPPCLCCEQNDHIIIYIYTSILLYNVY